MTEELKQNKIHDIYMILVNFENVHDKKRKNVTFQTYFNHLDRLCVSYLGSGDIEIYEYLSGLVKLGKWANHDTVKRIVFHIINLLDKEG